MPRTSRRTLTPACLTCSTSWSTSPNPTIDGDSSSLSRSTCNNLCRLVQGLTTHLFDKQQRLCGPSGIQGEVLPRRSCMQDHHADAVRHDVVQLAGDSLPLLGDRGEHMLLPTPFQVVGPALPPGTALSQSTDYASRSPHQGEDGKVPTASATDRASLRTTGSTRRAANRTSKPIIAVGSLECAATE